jgi:glycosyltransferase involved in cell wall biosynthesis
MRILISSDYFYPFLPGGGEKRMYEIGKRLARSHEVHVVTRKLANLPSYEEHENMRIHRVYVPFEGATLESFVNGLFFMLGAFFKASSLGRFDAYAPHYFFPVLPIWAASKAQGKSALVTIHDVFYTSELTKLYGLKGLFAAFFEKLMLRLPYRRVVTVSGASKEKLVAGGMQRTRIEIVPNGVDLMMFDKIRVGKSRKPRIIYVGRLIEYKHVDDLLLAFSKLSLDAELYVVGRGPERKKLEVLAKELKVDRRVVFTGFVSESRKIELLKSSHALVLPSTMEGFGIALVEAMAAKTPVIAADIPALRELVGDEEVGLLFKPRDIGALKMKLERLLKESKLRVQLSRKGHELVKKKFSWERITKEIESLLKT